MGQLVLTDAYGVEIRTQKLFEAGSSASKALPSGGTIETDDMQPRNPNIDAGNATVVIKVTGGAGDTVTVTAKLYHGSDIGYGNSLAVGTLADNGGILEYDLRLASWWGMLSFENRLKFILAHGGASNGDVTAYAIGHWK